MVMTSEFEKKLEELKAIYEAEMQKHSDALNEYEHKDDEWPSCGDDYWYISDMCFIESDRNCNTIEDNFRQKTGNIFRTKEEAEYHLRMIDLAWEVKKLSFEPDWGDGELCHVPYFSHPHNLIRVHSIAVHEFIKTHFATKELAEQAIDLFKSNDDFLYCLRKGLV